MNSITVLAIIVGFALLGYVIYKNVKQERQMTSEGKIINRSHRFIEQAEDFTIICDDPAIVSGKLESLPLSEMNVKMAFDLSTILDACTKQVLSYTLSESLEVDFVLETVEKLIDNHGISLNKNTILHSDQGCHYTCVKFIQLLKNSALRQSMSRRGNCWDNAPQESFFGHMKDELSREIPGWNSFADVERSIGDWIDYYNSDRYQWDLAKLSPNEYYDYLLSGIYPSFP